MDIREMVDRIEDLLNKIKDMDRQQRRRIRELENQLEPHISFPPIIPPPGSGDIR